MKRGPLPAWEKIMARRWVLAALALLVFAPGVPRADDRPKSLPKEILLLRHAEKPPDEAMSTDLSPAGRERAQALPRLFQKADGAPPRFPVPDYIFATHDSNRSQRPRLTITPLAKQLGLKINATYANDDYGELAHELFHDPKYAGKVVLICWHHGRIPELAWKLKAKQAPDAWDGKVFDRIWRIEYDAAGKAQFQDLPQQLLPGDAPK
jgi:hypothetical protein